MMKSKRTIQAAILSMALLVWMGACAGTSEMMDKPMNTAMDGMLAGSDGHHAAGQVAVDMAMGKTVLTLSDIKVDKVPDGHVYLTKDADHMHGVDLGKLTQFTGTVSFDVPAGVNTDDFDSVVIWCKQFNVEIGRAYLPKKMM
jgi:hypothetical protein